MSSAIALNLVKAKILSFGNEIRAGRYPSIFNSVMPLVQTSTENQAAPYERVHPQVNTM